MTFLKKELEEKVQTYLDEELYYYEDVEIKKLLIGRKSTMMILMASIKNLT